MFTGIIEEVGRVKSLVRGGTACVITVEADVVRSDAHVGDSIAVNGVCLTVTDLAPGAFSADVMSETLARSSLGALCAGCAVNLERAMPCTGRFGGHIVSGHIDGTGSITAIREEGNATWYTIAATPQILTLVVEKGSVALDGISLTVARVGQRDFSVSIIPHTREATNLSSRRVGDVLNIENDIIGKYVQRLMNVEGAAGGCDTDGAADGCDTGGAVGGCDTDGAAGGLGTTGATGATGANDTNGATGAAGVSGITEEFLLENGF